MGPLCPLALVFLSYLLSLAASRPSWRQSNESSEPTADLGQMRSPSQSEHVIRSVSVRARRETRVEAVVDLDVIKRRINESLVAASDLKLRANDTYHFLCKMKIVYLPHEDSTLNTCARFAERSIQDPDFDIPQLATFSFRTGDGVRQELKSVLSNALNIVGRYRFVVSNLTTLEENHLCSDRAGLQCGTANCHRHHNTDDPFAILCQMKILESRVRALYYSLRRTATSLDSDVKKDVQMLIVTSPPELSEYRRMMYGFGVTYQLHRQAQTFQYVLRFVNNLEEDAMDLT